MSAGQDIERRTPAQELVSRLRDPVAREQFAMVLPPSVTVEKFERIATTAILTNPDISKLDHTSVLRAMVQAAADGLMPDGKEGAIVGRGGNAVWQPMIGGFRRQIAEFGWQLKTQAVYEADEFEWSDEPPTRLHRQARPGVDRGAIIGAYAVARHHDGREEQKFMRWDDIAKRREAATTKAVWDKWPAEMAAKTVGRALCKTLPLAEADRERLARVYDAAVIDPAEASRLIYGPSETPALPSAPAGGVDNQPGQTDGYRPALPGGTSAVDTEGQQAAAAEAGTAVAAAPGPELEAEPSLDDEPAQTSFQTPTGVEDDPIVAAARLAAPFPLPGGQHKGLSLAEVHAKGAKGESWFRWALKEGDKLQPNDYRSAVWAFARVYLPEIYQEVLAWHEAQVAS